MEKKSICFSGKGIVTILVGMFLMSSIVVSISNYLIDLIML